MGTRRIHTTSFHGVQRHSSEMSDAFKLVSMAEYVSDMGFYDGMHEEPEQLWSAASKRDVENAVKQFKNSEKKPH